MLEFADSTGSAERHWDSADRDTSVIESQCGGTPVLHLVRPSLEIRERSDVPNWSFVLSVYRTEVQLPNIPTQTRAQEISLVTGVLHLLIP